MENRPTFTKLFILIAFMTTIYLLITIPLFKVAHMAIKSGDLSKFTSYFTKKLSFNRV